MLERPNDLLLSKDILLQVSSSKAAAVRRQGSKDGIMGRQDRLRAVLYFRRFAGILGKRRLAGCAERGLLLVLFAVVIATADSSHPRSSWSEWGPCSRSCETGVSRRVHSCRPDDSDCHPEAVQYRLCHPEVCPSHTSDPKTELCEMLGNELSKYPQQHWEAVYETGNPCALMCSSETNVQQVELADTVPDGTWCQPDGRAVCIRNQCVKPGCDNILGSSKTVDSCGVCGGNDTSCSPPTRDQRSTFTWKLKWTPCSVSCGVGKRTGNARCTNGSNSRTVSDHHCKSQDKPRTVFSRCFARRCGTDMQPDEPPASAISEGDLRDLMNDQIPEIPTYQIGEWSECTVTCGTGFRTRDVLCKVPSATSDETLPDTECFGGKPATHEKCHGAPCRGDLPPANSSENSLPDLNFRWHQEGFSDCSRSCAGGKQQSKIACLRDNNQVVRLSQCSHLRRPALIIRNCNTVPCPPRWEVGDYGPCSKLCGGGVMLRMAQCVQEEVGGVVSFLDDFRCPDPAPEREKSCNAHYCQTRWVTGPWTECSKSCGVGTQTRAARCVNEPVEGKEIKVPKVECQGPEPVTSRKCTVVDCPENTSSPPVIKAVNYTFTQLRRSKRLQLVVGGKIQLLPGQSLLVRCPVKNYHRRLIFWSKNFKLVPMAGRVRATFNGNLKIKQANPQSDAGTYTCLAGHESADVTIEFLSRAEVKDHIRHIQHYLADSSSHVTSVAPVEPQYKEGVAYDVGYNVTNQVVYVSGNWSTCSVTCGAGHQTRHVTCTRITYRYLKHLPDRECEKTGLVKPRETQECSQQPDCPQWSLGNWEKCSLNTCIMDGFAERRRPLMCAYPNGSLAPSGACDNKHRPESARRCVNVDCVSQWTTTAWTACQPSCGEKGIKARILMCTWQKTGLPAWTACKHKERPPTSEVCKPRPCPGTGIKECRDKSRYCSLAVMLRMCRVEDFRYKCCRSCTKMFESNQS